MLLVFCCKVLNTKKTNQHKNVNDILKKVIETKASLSARYLLLFLSNKKWFCFVIAVML